jgi:dihydropteroate synthase
MMFRDWIPAFAGMTAKDFMTSSTSHLQCGRYRLALDWPLVMGVLNVTPDSFSDGGRFVSLEAALDQAEQMIDAGADIIDIGGESSRPGAPMLTVEQELERIMPVLYALRDCGKPLSVDTCKPAVMREALAAGADMINDIAGFRSPEAFSAV